MNKEIHPKYNKAKITCSTCDSVYEIGSTEETIKIDTCSNCHPLYTG